MSFFGNRRISNEIIKSFVPPMNTNVFWLDISTTPAILKYFNEITNQWEQIGGSEGTIDISVIDGGIWT